MDFEVTSNILASIRLILKSDGWSSVLLTSGVLVTTGVWVGADALIEPPPAVLPHPVVSA